MKILKLPVSLKPTQRYPLVRLGSNRDGGYLIDERLLASDLMSFGIAGNWEFEKHWRTVNSHATIETYDGSISGIRFVTTAILSLLRPHKPTLILRNFVTALEYWTFLKSQTRFARWFIGHSQSNHWINYGSLISTTTCEAPFFLKIDIEGHEYQVLDEIIEHQQLLSGLAIEFHRPISNLQNIESFISRLALEICSVHPNNCLPKDNAHAEPSLEVTFSSHKGLNQDPCIPDNLEEDNDASCVPIRLSFTDTAYSAQKDFFDNR